MGAKCSKPSLNGDDVTAPISVQYSHYRHYRMHKCPPGSSINNTQATGFDCTYQSTFIPTPSPFSVYTEMLLSSREANNPLSVQPTVWSVAVLSITIYSVQALSYRVQKYSHVSWILLKHCWCCTMCCTAGTHSVIDPNQEEVLLIYISAWSVISQNLTGIILVSIEALKGKHNHWWVIFSCRHGLFTIYAEMRNLRKEKKKKKVIYCMRLKLW